MSECSDTLNLKTTLPVEKEKWDFEIYRVDKGLIKAIKLNNDIFELNNGVKQSIETNDLKNIEKQNQKWKKWAEKVAKRSKKIF